MTFAAKVGKDETIKISSGQQIYLNITNIALGPKQTKASVYLREKESNDFILIVQLEKERLKSYNCNIRLHLQKDHSEQIFSENGETNIIGYEVCIQRVLPKNCIKITRENQSLKKNVEQQENKIQSKPKRLGKKVAIQPKTTGNKQENNKKQKSLLQMMKNLDKENSSESDDESYEQESQSQESDDSQSEEEEEAAPKQAKKASKKAQNDRNKKKKISWAQMLQQAMQQSSEDQDKEQIQSEEQLDDKTPEVQPKKQKTRQIPAQKEQPKVSKGQEKKGKRIPQTALNPESDSSSFQFTIPKGLPSFLKNS